MLYPAELRVQKRVGNGARTHGLRNHNPALVPTELYPPCRRAFLAARPFGRGGLYAYIANLSTDFFDNRFFLISARRRPAAAHLARFAPENFGQKTVNSANIFNLRFCGAGERRSDRIRSQAPKQPRALLRERGAARPNNRSRLPLRFRRHHHRHCRRRRCLRLIRRKERFRRHRRQTARLRSAAKRCTNRPKAARIATSRLQDRTFRASPNPIDSPPKRRLYGVFPTPIPYIGLRR